MKTTVLIIANLSLLGLFLYLLFRKNGLSYYRDGRIWLTWLSVAVITLMDELTSVFYAPAEAYRFIGPSAIVFIAFTAAFVHYMTTRLVEIAEILEHHKIFGGGVYSFSYLVLGPTVSFVAVSSIMVDYILTACLSAVSAVENATSFLRGVPHRENCHIRDYRVGGCRTQHSGNKGKRSVYVRYLHFGRVGLFQFDRWGHCFSGRRIHSASQDFGGSCVRSS